MASKQIWLSASDGKQISVRLWSPETDDIKGIVQISHGMAEYIERYDHFANFLNQNGFIVYGNDHRGHGDTAGDPEKIGYFADYNGWDRVVEDIREINQMIGESNPDLPLFLFGHSMGSLLSRSFISKYGDRLNGVLLSATAGDPGLLGKAGQWITALVIKTKGRHHRSPLLNQLTFGKFNQGFKPPRTDFDWLSRNEKIVDQYIADSRCGGLFMAGFYKDLLYGVGYINQQTTINQTPADLPILFFSGANDPVGDNTKGVKSVVKKFKKAGITKITEKYYPEGRHEMLNETNRDEVYADVLNWIKNYC